MIGYNNANNAQEPKDRNKLIGVYFNPNKDHKIYNNNS